MCGYGKSKLRRGRRKRRMSSCRYGVLVRSGESGVFVVNLETAKNLRGRDATNWNVSWPIVAVFMLRNK